MKLAIASGKGGTGKTTIATNLAVTLAAMNIPVQLLDCDAEEPNAHLFLNPVQISERTVNSLIPKIDPERCNLCGVCVEICAYTALAIAGEKVMFFPELCHSCGGCARLCPEEAIIDIERPIGTVLKARVNEMDLIWGKLKIGLPLVPALIAEVRKEATASTVIIDAPPGTSCAAVAAISDCDLCLLVTEPTAFGLHDLTLAAEMAKELNVPSFVVINRADLGDDRVRTYCQENDLPVLLEIPFSRELAACYARGQLWVKEFPQWRDAFQNLWKQIEEHAHERAIGN